MTRQRLALLFVAVIYLQLVVAFTTVAVAHGAPPRDPLAAYGPPTRHKTVRSQGHTWSCDYWLGSSAFVVRCIVIPPKKAAAS